MVFRCLIVFVFCIPFTTATATTGCGESTNLCYTQLCELFGVDVVLLPDSPVFPSYAYNRESSAFNTPNQQPDFVVAAESDEHVIKTLECATSQKVPIKVRVAGGNHNYAGFSGGPPDGILISMARFKHLSVVTGHKDGDKYAVPRVDVGAGYRFGDVYSNLSSSKETKDLIFNGGFCPEVGVVGFHLGGGLGSVCRTFGMGIDSVQFFDIVVQVEKKAEAEAEDEAEAVFKSIRVDKYSKGKEQRLFWALRGGGGPTFGVVTKIGVMLHSAEAHNIKHYSYGELCVSAPNREHMEEEPAKRTAAKENMKRDLGFLADATTYNPETRTQKDFPYWLSVHWRLLYRDVGLTSGLCYLIYSTKGIKETIAELKESILQPLTNRVAESESQNGGDLLESLMDVDPVRRCDDPLSSIPRPDEHKQPFWNCLGQYETYLAMDDANAAYKGYLHDYIGFPGGSVNCVLPAMDQGLANILVDLYFDKDTPKSCTMQGMALGANVSHVKYNETAFPFRDQVSYAADTGCGYQTPSEKKATEAFYDKYLTTLQKNNYCQGAYQNFPFVNENVEFANAYWNNPRTQTQPDKPWNNLDTLSCIRAEWELEESFPLVYEQSPPLPRSGVICPSYAEDAVETKDEL